MEGEGESSSGEIGECKGGGRGCLPDKSAFKLLPFSLPPSQWPSDHFNRWVAGSSPWIRPYLCRWKTIFCFVNETIKHKIFLLICLMSCVLNESWGAKSGDSGSWGVKLRHSTAVTERDRLSPPPPPPSLLLVPYFTICLLAQESFDIDGGTLDKLWMYLTMTTNNNYLFFTSGKCSCASSKTNKSMLWKMINFVNVWFSFPIWVGCPP